VQVFTDSFKDCKVDCKLMLPYLDAVGGMLFPVGSLSDTMLNIPLTTVYKCMTSLARFNRTFKN
jgi:hypothetical protein